MISPQDFLQDVLPSDQNAYFVLLPSKRAEKAGKSGKYHKSVMSPEAMAGLVKGRKNKDTWYAVAGYAQARVRDGDRWRYRIKSNVSAVRSLVLDIDVDITGTKPELAPSKSEAMGALKDFLKATGFFKPSYIVDSGGGYHVYWCMTDNIDPPSWFSTAAKLKRVLAKHGGYVAGDLTRVADLAGVLRVPGTDNCKLDEPRPVKIVYPAKSEVTKYDFTEVRAWLEEQAPAEDRDQLRFSSSLKLPTVPDEVRARVRGFPAHIALDTYSPDFVSIQAGCAILTKVVNEQADVREPLWYAALGLLSDLPEDTADDLAQSWSSEHPDYNQRTTSRKLLQVREQQGGNPTTCSTLEDRAQGQGWVSPCGSCPLKKQVNTPYRITPEMIRKKGTIEQVEKVRGRKSERPEEEADAEDGDDHISGFQITPEGLWAYLPLPDDKSTVIYQLVSGTVVAVEAAIRDAVTGIVVAYRLSLKDNRGRRRVRDVAADKFGEARHLRAALMEMGASFTARDVDGNHTMRYIKNLRSKVVKRDGLISTRRFGMADDWSSFTVGSTVFTADGSHEAIVHADIDAFANNFATTGTLDAWCAAVDPFLAHHQMQGAALFAAASAGSPVMKLLGLAGVVINLVGESSRGKSVGMSVAHSIWGKPIENAASQEDTAMYAMKALAAYHNIPLVYDEVTNIEATQLRNFSLAVSQGRERGSLNQDRTARKPLSGWGLVALMSSNTSILAKVRNVSIGREAELMRILEVPAARKRIPVEFANTVISPMLLALDDNHGVLAPLLARTYIKHKDHLRAAARERYQSWLAKLPSTEHRYRAAALASAEIGGQLLYNLGLKSMSKNKILQILDQTVRQVHNDTQPIGAAERRFVEELHSWVSSRGVVLYVEKEIIENADNPVARIDYRGTKAFMSVSAADLASFCRQRQDLGTQSTIQSALMRAGLLEKRSVQVFLSSHSRTRVNCRVFNYHYIDARIPTRGSLPEKP